VLCCQMTTKEGQTQNIEFRLQSSYGRNATIHQACIRIELYAFSEGDRRPTDATSAMTLALYVDDQYIDEHVVGARHVTTSSALSPAAARRSRQKRSHSADGHQQLGLLRWLTCRHAAEKSRLQESS